MYSFTDNYLRFYKYRHYFTLGEIWEAIIGEPIDDTIIYGLVDKIDSIGLFRYAVELLRGSDFTDTQVNGKPISKEIADKLMQLYIIPNHWDDYIGYIDTVKPELDTDAYNRVKELAYEWSIKLVAVLNNTYDLYNDRLSYYDDLKAGLTTGPEHVTVSTYKDLPQDSAVEPELPNDVRRTQENRDIDNKAARLKEINEAISNIMYEWATEFDALFIAPAGDGAEETLSYF